MGCLKLSIGRRGKVLQVVKEDGKIIEFKSAVLVKQLLLNFRGFGVKQSKPSGKFLPPSFELHLGKTYYLCPWKCPVPAEDAAAEVKRIKIVITKKQLEEMLSKQTNPSADLAAIWRPSLFPIPEENEL
ncbi:hypothetical protein SASPL_101252 [Salvia splendens]|uniref:Uncharacterized protein n=1 Tax=Salvia splendens TaxID=180675 RepID=A0A8X8YPQ7_SALSN|nr:hypothetical protein SASPL_101252 [Salvia splendens]